MTKATMTPNRRALLDAKKAAWELTVGTFFALLKHNGIPLPEREVRFAEGRKWAFDFAWPAHKIALEVEGGAWTRGRHTRGAGFLEDMEKYNAAAAQGWMLFRTTPDRLFTVDGPLVYIGTALKTSRMFPVSA